MARNRDDSGEFEADKIEIAAQNGLVGLPELNDREIAGRHISLAPRDALGLQRHPRGVDQGSATPRAPSISLDRQV